MRTARLRSPRAPAAGTRGTIRTSNVDGKAGAYTVQFASALAATPANGDYLVVRSLQPGDPTAGWWTSFECGATATEELHDLPPHSPGRQVLRIAAAKPCQRAALNSYFDSTPGHSFVHLNGAYTLRFQAKALTPNSTLQVRFSRESGPVYFNKTVPLQPGWHTYTLPFSATEKQTEKASTAGLSFTAASTSLLLADISLTADIVPAHHNPTAFRDEVVDTLRDLHPGILRYMDSGTDFGTSLDDWLTPPAGRPRTGYSLWATRQEDISLGLHEFLTLTQAVSTGQAPTEPWISLPAAFSPEEARHLIDYLAGPPTTTYGSLRARLGHPRPWTESFPRIHLELGNEVWNRGSFAGATIDDPAAYAVRAATVFRAMRSAPAFTPARFDLVAGSFFEVPAHTAAEAVALHRSADTLSVAPYLFTHFNDATSTEAVFGPMLAQPEQWTTIGGLLRQQADAVHANSPATRLNLYEVNLGTVTGSPAISQADIDRTVPSTGAALAVADLMLLALRDLGVTEQCFFALTEFRNGFTSPGGGTARTTPLFGAVVDMGGATDRPPAVVLRFSAFSTRPSSPTLLKLQPPAVTLPGLNPRAPTTTSLFRRPISCRALPSVNPVAAPSSFSTSAEQRLCPSPTTARTLRAALCSRQFLPQPTLPTAMRTMRWSLPELPLSSTSTSPSSISCRPSPSPRTPGRRHDPPASRHHRHAPAA